MTDLALNLVLNITVFIIIQKPSTFEIYKQ